jgi:hypothetical protein
MVGREQFESIMKWIPRDLGRVDNEGHPVPYELMLARDYGVRLRVPSISVGILSDGRITEYHDSLLRTTADAHGILTDTWGHHQALTLSLHLRAYSAEERREMKEQMLLKLWKDRFNLEWERDRVRFVDIISKGKTEFQDRDERVDQQKRIYRSVIDIEMEYEFSYERDEPVLITFGYIVNVVDKRLGSWVVTQYTRDSELIVGAALRKSHSAGYGMGVTINGP